MNIAILFGVFELRKRHQAGKAAVIVDLAQQACFSSQRRVGATFHNARALQVVGGLGSDWPPGLEVRGMSRLGLVFDHVAKAASRTTRRQLGAVFGNDHVNLSFVKWSLTSGAKQLA
jgi:hypothetical protein